MILRLDFFLPRQPTKEWPSELLYAFLLHHMGGRGSQVMNRDVCVCVCVWANLSSKI